MNRLKNKITVSLLIVPLAVLSYLAYATIFSVISVNNTYQASPKGIPVYVSTNGVHTDITLPAQTSTINWLKKLFPNKNTAYKYIAFGWGDKTFYAETPSWSDFRLSTGLKALFYSEGSAMHIKGLTYQPIESEKVYKLTLNLKEFQQLVDFIERSFQTDQAGSYIPIYNHHYGNNDFFYEGEGVYSFLNTCNNWTNSALKASGVRTAVWAPFEKSVMYHRVK
ncbi:TIGR02117 family protein [Cytophagaceae bacterium ABcell3]|nr:TIGR02117 family protein [Cytophagaceae bacterium ABcell3]